MIEMFFDKNYFVVPKTAWTADILMELPKFFSDLRFEEYGDFVILYKKGLDYRQCLLEYIDCCIKFEQDMIDRVSEIDSRSSMDIAWSLKDFFDQREKEIGELKETRMKISI